MAESLIVALRTAREISKASTNDRGSLPIKKKRKICASLPHVEEIKGPIDGFSVAVELAPRRICT